MPRRAGRIGSRRSPTEEEQKRERQRLFDILGRITIETDRKGKEKQKVRRLAGVVG